MSASTVGATPAHRRVHIVVLDAQTHGGFRPCVSLDRPRLAARGRVPYATLSLPDPPAERDELRTRRERLARSRPRLPAAWAYAQAVSVCGETACRSDSGGHGGR